jgi:streptomycin 6-kinase
VNGARDPFRPSLSRWRLEADGSAIETPTSWLLPVRRDADALMLKVLKPGSDETDGIHALRWFGGEGAVRLIEADRDAVLMERATGSRSLGEMALAGEDDAAASILAATAVRLHRPRGGTLPRIRPLSVRFRALFALASQRAVLGAAADVATGLLAEPRDIVVLHGDLHHENVLDSSRGWLAIDPKGVVGEATYDLANLFLNPWGATRLTQDPARARRLADRLAADTARGRARILAFAFAHAGLSAAWDIEDGKDPSATLATAEMLQAFAV